jgi:hypothetical protein
MDLPKEFFTPQSATTLTGAVAITYVVSNTIQSALNFNPRWLALLIAMGVSGFGVWYTKGGPMEYLFGVLNGCLVYLTAVGTSTVSGKLSSPVATTRGAFEPVLQKRKFSTNWW